MPATSPTARTIQELLKVASLYLQEKGIDSPRLTAEVLLACLLGVDRVTLYLHFNRPLTETEVSGYRSLIRRRVAREPVQHITGHQEFWSLDFSVDRRALIPRPETELLVEKALERIRGADGPGIDAPEILDIGTGAGPIAVSLASEVPTARIVATDISLDALEVARINASNHLQLDRIAFRRGDLFGALKEGDGPFDLIVSNPPYVADEEFHQLPPEVRGHEPHVALRGYATGFRFVERILREALPFLRRGGWILLEMAPAQTERAISLIGRLQGYEGEKRVRDYSGRFRVVMAGKA